jgi:dTDP-4-dehydrorhamnose 3,5-epimerase
MRLVLGGGKAQLLYVPRGVAHGAANLWAQAASIIYFVNQQFCLEHPDEGRLPWDLLGKDIWEVAKG